MPYFDESTMQAEHPPTVEDHADQDQERTDLPASYLDWSSDPSPPQPDRLTPQPDRLTPGGAIGRHPFLVILPLVLLLAAGIVVGNRKPLTYSATATINVGKSDINTQATPGYVQASEALATTYSRLVTSQHITNPVSRAVGESSATVASQLSSVPIPSEPTFSITAAGSSAAVAVRLANATVSALQKYVNRSATQQGGPAQLLNRFRRADTIAETLLQTSQTLAGRFAGHVPGVTSAQVAQARVASQTAQLQATALSNQYLNLASSGVAPSLDVLVNPTGTTTTNRTSNIEKYGIIGGVGGLVIGIALAGLASGIGSLRRRRFA